MGQNNFMGGVSGILPDVALDQQAVMRRRALADALTASSMKGIDPMRSAGNLIVPIAPMEGLAQLGEALLARHVSKDAQSQEQELAQRAQARMNELLEGTSQPIQPQAPQFGAAPPAGDPNIAQFQPSGAMSQPDSRQQQGGLLSMPGINADLARALRVQFALNPSEGVKSIVDAVKPTEAIRTLQLQGIDPKQMGSYLLGKAQNDATFTVAPGTLFVRPGEAPAIAPDMKTGLEAAPGPDGRFITRAMQGAPEARATMQGAETRAIEQAKAETELVEMYDPASKSYIKVPKSTLLPNASTAPVQPGAPATGGLGGLRPQSQPSGTEKAADANVALVDTQFVNKILPALIEKSNAARDGNAQVTALRSIVASPKFETGAFVESKAAFGNALAGLGLATKDIARFTSDVQRFQLITTDMALNKQLMQSGVQTEGDSKRTFQTIANLQNTPAANAFALDWMEAVNNAQIKKAEFFEAGMNAMNAAGKPNFGEITDAWRRLNGGKGYSIWQDPVLQKYAAPKAR